MKKMIAYKTVDMEGDAWAERAFLFQNEGQVKVFFNENNPDFVNIFTDENDRNIYNLWIREDLASITFSTEYAGDVKIYCMASGFLITSP